MRYVILLALAVLLAVPVAAMAKSVVYVTRESATGLGCSSLSGNDKLFCQRLEKLGYETKIVSDSNVIFRSSIWNEMSGKASLIFLGNVSTDAVNTSKYGRQFCGSISNAGKKIFATSLNVRKLGDLSGCGFEYLSLDTRFSDNACADKQKTVWVTKESYISKGFSKDEPIIIYSSPGEILLYTIGTEQTKYFSVNCKATNGVTLLWPTIGYNSTRGTFFGLTKPSAFTEDGWKIFDRAVLYTTGDYLWNVTFFTIPKTVTAGKTFMVFSTVKSFSGPITTGSVRTVFENESLGGLEYRNETGFWEKRDLKIDRSGNFSVNAEDGSDSIIMEAGKLDIEILSGNYAPGNYTIRATASVAGTPAFAALNYRVFNDMLEAVASGTLDQHGNYHVGSFTAGEYGDLTLEVTGISAEGESGGAFKTIKMRSDSETELRIEPADWIITATTPGSESRKFAVSVQTELTGIKVSKGGTLGPRIKIEQEELPSSMDAGGTAGFSATIDWGGIEEGEYTGEIIFDSDQASSTIQVKLNRFNITGNFLSVQEKELFLNIPAGQTERVIIKISNAASLPATGITLTAAGEKIGGKVRLENEHLQILERGSLDIPLLLDTSGLDEGKNYKWVVKIRSSLGEADINFDLLVGPDLKALIDGVESEHRESVSGRSLSGESKQLSLLVNSSLESARSALERRDFRLAQDSFKTANMTLYELKAELSKPPFDFFPILVIVAIIGVAAVGIFIFLKWRKAAAEKKKTAAKKLPESEDKYRFEYY